MKRPIKFRGRDTADGVRENVTFTLNELLAVFDEYELVDPDSVVQLVGYDCDGREVYEGDTIIHTMSNHESVAEYGYNPAYIKMTKLKDGTK